MGIVGLIAVTLLPFYTVINIEPRANLISVSIEFLQYISMFCGNIRSVDMDDVILTTTQWQKS
jgi:glycopeptide antibiotics resistance protein